MQQSELEVRNTQLRADLRRAGYLLDGTLDQAQLGVQCTEQVVQASLLRLLHEGLLEEQQRVVIAVLLHRFDSELQELLGIDPRFDLGHAGLPHWISGQCSVPGPSQSRRLFKPNTLCL